MELPLHLHPLGRVGPVRSRMTEGQKSVISGRDGGSWTPRYSGVRLRVSKGNNIEVYVSGGNGANNETFDIIRSRSSLGKIRRVMRRAQRWADKENEKNKTAGASVRAIRLEAKVAE